MTKMFCTYVDLTYDLIPFYVGKGNVKRFNQLRHRNKKHTNVANKYGQIRIIVIESDNEFDTLAEEIVTIRDCQTYHYDDPTNNFACNFTRGGEGTSGTPTHNKGIPCKSSTKELIRQSLLGNIPWNKGRKAPESERLAQSLRQRGKPPANKGKPSPLRGRPSGKKGTKNPEHAAKLKGRPSEKKGKRSQNALRIIADIEIIQHRLSAGESKAQLAKEYEAPYSSFTALLLFHTQTRINVADDLHNFVAKSPIF